jgi:general stress protein 26
MWLAWLAGMGIGTATIEMQSPEEHRERLHDLLKATRTVMMLSVAPGREAGIVGRPMALLHTADDTTMYAVTWLDALEAADLVREPRVAVAVQGTCCALFDAEATIARDRTLIDQLAAEWAARGGRADPSSALLVISPIAGTYWDGPHRHSYQYRLSPPPEQREVSDGVPVGV